MQTKFKKNIKNNFYIVILISIIFIPVSYLYAAFSCSVTTQAGCSGTTLLRMSDELPTTFVDSTPGYNSQAELPSQSTATYDDYVVCCSGVTGLGNSCSGNYEVFAKLSSITNAHVEQRTQSNYSQNACLSSSFAGDVITIGYQASNCTGYDTTLFSMEKTPTNSMIGIPTAYNNKVCAKVFSQSITFNLSSTSAGFGNLNPSGYRYATSSGTGSATETESYNVSASTNAPSGYIIMLKGDTLTKNISVITPIGGTNMTPSPGSKAFGIRAVATGGSGAVMSPYNGAGFAYDASSTNFTSIAQAASGDGVSTTYSIRSIATIDSLLDPGNYSTNLVYVVTANF